MTPRRAARPRRTSSPRRRRGPAPWYDRHQELVALSAGALAVLIAWLVIR